MPTNIPVLSAIIFVKIGLGGSFVIKKILFLCMTLMILLMPKGPVEAAGITAYEKFISPAYWTEHNADGDKVVLNAAGVEAFNKDHCRIADSL